MRTNIDTKCQLSVRLIPDILHHHIFGFASLMHEFKHYSVGNYCSRQNTYTKHQINSDNDHSRI